jgi:7-cyano-7-deazaguanine synthase in queuosine biosynthesis
MGHQRLGEIPKTQRWKEVVAKVAGAGGGGAGLGGPVEGVDTLISDVESVASEVLDAAAQGLAAATNDLGLRFTFYTLTQIVLAARQPDWKSELASLGIQASDTSSIFDLTSDVQAVIDDYNLKLGRRTDISEMAGKAASDALTSLSGPRAKTLFGTGPDELKDAIRELSTKKGFSRLGQKFFGRFMYRFLNFYLSRITPRQVGSERLANALALSEFAGPAAEALKDGRHVVELSTGGSRANVNLSVEDVAKRFSRDLQPRLADLLEIAAYVYAADCATARSGAWANAGATEPWQRDLKFAVPVEDIDFWSDESVQGLLQQILGFLSDDTYSFTFVKASSKQRGGYLHFGDDDDWPFRGPDRVIMFSGGLDSLAGAVETASQGKNLVLVSHRPVSTQSKRQTALFASLRKAFPKVQMIHVPIWVNKDESKSREYSQRTRSFLFSALGAVVGASVQAEGIRFFENGIVSLNFPVADEVIGARASRTTHPQVLKLFAEFYQRVLGRPFEVDNPFLFKTKAEVVALIRKHGHAGLIPQTCSCAHQGFFQSKTQWHCGGCSQCIDRKMAILANDIEDNEDAHDYVIDVLSGARKNGYERNMAVNYARHAQELSQLGANQIAERFATELSRAVRPLPNRREAAANFVAMHERHAATVQGVIVKNIKLHAGAIVDGTIPESSLLSLVAGRHHLVSSWRSYAHRITDILTKGLPPTCQTKKPDNEPRLQEVCDGLLQGADVDLTREYPFMRWGSNLTKPDWSSEELRLWVEAKYVRKKADVRQINEDIAADITKYGDNRRRVLFVVYDPQHLIIDEPDFRRPIEARPEMLVCFIR